MKKKNGGFAIMMVLFYFARVFFEVSMASIGVVGKMVAMLYSDYVPMTVKNFLAFCNPKANLTYKGNFFYFIFQNYYCQTGDVVENKGYGGTSIYGPYFGNEDLSLRHGQRGEKELLINAFFFSNF